MCTAVEAILSVYCFAILILLKVNVLLNNPPAARPTRQTANTVSASTPSAGSGQHSASDKNNAAQSETTQFASATAQGNVITPDMLAAVLATVASSGSQGTRPIDLSTVLTRSNVQDIVTKNAERLESLLPDQSPIIEQGVELKRCLLNIFISKK